MRFSSKLLLLFLLMISSYSYAALSATTVNTIQGNQPRLSLDLEQKIIDGNFSRFGFTYAEQNYDDENIANFPQIEPVTVTPAILISQLTSTFDSILSDDEAQDVDGDNHFTLNAINISGNSIVNILPTQLSIKIRDRNNNDLSSNNATKDKTFCDLATSSTNPAPYKIEISHDLRLTTAYGDPIGKNYTQTTGETLKQPAKQYPFTIVPSICYAKPYIGTSNSGKYAGPATEWHADKGFLPQSSSDNFPTTGANKLYFDLVIIGVDATTLNWQKTLSAAGENDISVDMTNMTSSSVRVLLGGPAATDSQKKSNTPGAIPIPTLPAQIKLEGKDNNGLTVVKYDFDIKQWFVGRGSQGASLSAQTEWCANVGYIMPLLKDYTNASGTATGQGGAIPWVENASSGNYFQRRIHAGFFSEWSRLTSYDSNDWGSGNSPTWTGDKVAGTSNIFTAYSAFGGSWAAYGSANHQAGCVSHRR